MRDKFTIMAALPKQALRVCLLKIPSADFGTRDVGRDREDRYTGSMAIKEAIDEVEIARPAATGAHRQLSRQMCLRTRRESRCLFMPSMNPFYVTPFTK